MSSGPHDAMAEGRLADDVENRAYDLANAIKNAHAGHRGMYFSDAQIMKMVNSALNDTGFKLVKK